NTRSTRACCAATVSMGSRPRASPSGSREEAMSVMAGAFPVTQRDQTSSTEGPDVAGQGERLERRSLQHVALRVETRTVTRAVPAPLGLVPPDRASQVRARQRDREDG